MWYVAAYLGLVAVTSLASFAAYGVDKRRAAVGGRRVPERTLHLLAVLGGWPGAILGQRYFRHKTRKVPFLIAFWAVVVLHVAVVGAAAYTLFRPPRADLGMHRVLTPHPSSAEYGACQELRPGCIESVRPDAARGVGGIKMVGHHSSGNIAGLAPTATMAQPVTTFSPSRLAFSTTSGASAPGLRYTSVAGFAAISSSTFSPTAGGR
jgi:uncharacterized membrane protein YsdA (DUF1294 family)